MEPPTASAVIQLMDRNSGRMLKRSISAPAVNAISETAIPLNRRNRNTISPETRSRT